MGRKNRHTTKAQAAKRFVRGHIPETPMGSPYAAIGDDVLSGVTADHRVRDNSISTMANRKKGGTSVFWNPYREGVGQ